MLFHSIFRGILAGALCLGFGFAALMAQDAGTGILKGTVVVKGKNAVLEGASVQIIQLGRSTHTDREGKYEFLGVPPGSYHVASHMHALMDDALPAQVLPGQITVVDFQLSFEHLHHEVTVTATGKEQLSFESFQAVTVLDTLELGAKPAFGLGDLTENLPGVHKRSFGPGSARPVLRGFDGDRVLVLADGLPSGTLSSQSGEHAEPIDGSGLDRLEIVKGPATLLYGSNAIGGVVNAVTEHHLVHEHPHAGLRASVHTSGSTNNNHASGGASMEYGFGRWLVWTGGSRNVAGDFYSPEGRVENSKTRLTSGSVGFGWFGEKPFFTLGYAFNKGRFGVPYAGELHYHLQDSEEEGDVQTAAGRENEEEEAHAPVDETFTWQNVRIGAGLRELGSFADKFRLTASFGRWMHKELENDTPATAFDNKLWSFRGTFDQRKAGVLTGTLGFQGSYRDYIAQGEEALTPPVTSGSFALFALEELGFDKASLQFGGRFERTSYDPMGISGRSFNGFSGAAGVRIPLWKEGVIVVNYTHSHRAPALEELYSHGPHFGNLAYEIGDPTLVRELSNGVDLSLRHDSERVHGDVNFFRYSLRNFVHLALTGETEHGLRVAEYSQADARFTGAEANLNLVVHPNLWLNLGMDAVRAAFAASGDPLPRIPPLRGRFGFDVKYKGFSLKPALVLANDQSRLYPTETRTAGYTVINLDASYILARRNLAHVFSLGLFNVGDRLHRNHLSFIKDLAPEMGRGIRFSYSVRIF